MTATGLHASTQYVLYNIIIYVKPLYKVHNSDLNQDTLVWYQLHA